MGRYYDTDSGRSGKFMFGVQPSDDPEYMGMTEDNTKIRFYSGEEDEPNVRAKLDEQYDILEIPKDKRIYYIKDWGEYDKYEKETLEDKVWVKVKRGSKEEEQHRGEDKWASDKPDEVMFEKTGTALVLARIRLGLVILSDIKDEGYCSLEAET